MRQTFPAVVESGFRFTVGRSKEGRKEGSLKGRYLLFQALMSDENW